MEMYIKSREDGRFRIMQVNRKGHSIKTCWQTPTFQIKIQPIFREQGSYSVSCHFKWLRLDFFQPCSSFFFIIQLLTLSLTSFKAHWCRYDNTFARLLCAKGICLLAKYSYFSNKSLANSEKKSRKWQNYTPVDNNLLAFSGSAPSGWGQFLKDYIIDPMTVETCCAKITNYRKHKVV